MPAFTALLLTMTASTAPPAAASAPAEQPWFMFVHVAEDVRVDKAAQSLRLVDVNDQTLFFSDRPERIAGHLKMDKYLEEWTEKAGPEFYSSLILSDSRLAQDSDLRGDRR